MSLFVKLRMGAELFNLELADRGVPRHPTNKSIRDLKRIFFVFVASWRLVGWDDKGISLRDEAKSSVPSMTVEVVRASVL